MYQFAYPAAAGELPVPSSLTLSHKLSLALELFEFADGKDCTRCAQLGALSEFRRLWLSIVNGLIQAAGTAPAGPAEPAVIALAQAVIEDIDGRRMREGTGLRPRRKPLA